MDIKIIGAGPGGLITGLKLLEAGFKPTIIEKQEEIVSTLCGEGISGATLEKVPFRNWSEYSAQEFSHATFVFPGGHKAYVNKKCYTMDRTPWLRAMTREFVERGGRLELGRKVVSISDLKADLIVGADGPFSIAAKYVGNTTKHIAGVQYSVKSDYVFDGMEFHLDKNYSQEYSWVFARGSTLNVGLLGKQQDLERFMEDKGLGDSEILKKEGYNIPFFGTKIQEGNVVLTGDAAGITNPLTKGGMAAIVHVADILVGCLKEGKLEEYQSRVFSHPVMAPEYHRALEYFQELTNEKLENMGRMFGGRDFDNLRTAAKIKIGLAMLVKPKVRNLRKAVSYSNRYSW